MRDKGEECGSMQVGGGSAPSKKHKNRKTATSPLKKKKIKIILAPK
jgi:hypothetical protein